MPTQKTKFLTHIVPYLGMFLLALLLWLPFGFKTTGLIEEIGINELLDNGEQLYFVMPSSPMAGLRTRPLQMITFATAYALDHNSYLFYNIFMLIFFFGEMAVVYGLVLQFLPGKKAVAFVTGVLFAIYPADTGLFSLRTIHIHCAILAFLMAVYLLIRFWRLQGRRSWLMLFGAMIFLIFSLEQYESPLVAAAVTPFILLYFKRINRRFFIGAAAWYSSIALILVYAFWISRQSTMTTYEDFLLGKDLLSMQSIIAMFQALLLGYQRQFTGWANAFNQLNYLSLFWSFIVTGLIISVISIWWVSRRQEIQPEVKPVQRWQYVLLLLSGIIIFALGMATYLPVPTHRFQDFRIYFLSMLGSALVLTLSLYLISRVIPRYSNLLFTLFTLPFIGLAMLNAFQQQQYFVNFSLEQQSILQQIVEQAPQVKPNTTILIMDRTGILDQDYVFYYGVYLPSMLHYLYQDKTLKSNYCKSDNEVTQMGVRCRFDSTMLISTNEVNGNLLGSPLTETIDKLLIFETKFGGGVHLLSTEEAAQQLNITSGYDPQARISGQVPPPRAATLFSCEPAMSCYKLPGASSTRFDLPTDGVIGIGWRGIEDDGAGGTFRWSILPAVTIDMNLSDSSDLALEFKVLHWVDSSVIDSLKLTLNDGEIPLTFESTDDGGRIYHAIIPRSLLMGHLSQTQLVFAVDKLSVVSDTQSLGFALNWLRIRPV